MRRADILGHLANRLDQRGSGQIAGISSVAGLRGRAMNFVYGSSKAAFTAFLSGSATGSPGAVSMS